jgi:3-oxoacyl-[acyl-carrier protein] reductase
VPLGGLVVLVTGGSSGIGRAIATACARAGADVALTYAHQEAGASETASQVTAAGRRAAVFHLDLDARDGLEPALASLARDVAKAFGRIDVWINNAGADILTGDGAALPVAAKLDLLLAVDLRGTILASWAAVEHMRTQERGGVIVNMSWDHVITGMAGRNPQIFAAVKGGVLAFSKSLARSVAPLVRVNTLAPGWIETAFGDGLDAARRREVAQATPLQRWGTPADVAAAAVYLASPAAAFLTGQTIFVNGGVVMG